MNFKWIVFLGLLSSVGLSQNVDCELAKTYRQQLPGPGSFQELVSLLIDAGDFAEADYYLEQMKLYEPDFETLWQNETKISIRSKLAESKSCGCDLTRDSQWVSAQGPEGCDATSFYVDDDGGYWLGTGSSGGVYFSSNKGKSWSQRNNGIGPWHVVAFIERNDTLYIQINDERGANDGYARIYWYDSEMDFWKYVYADHYYYGDFKEGEGAKAVYISIQEQQKARIKSEKEFLNYTGFYAAQYSYSSADHFRARGIDPKYGPDDYENHAAMRIFGFKESNSSLAAKNKNFPRDMFALKGGNYYEFKKLDVLLSKSGPYLVKKKSISPMSMDGVVATDIRQIINANGKSYVLVNEADIWKLENDNWSCIFNAYEEHLKMDDPISHTGYDTKQLNYQKDGSILFSFCGELWKMNPNETFEKIPLDFNTFEAIYKNPKMVVSSAGYLNEELYVQVDVLDLMNKDNGIIRDPEMRSYTMLVKIIDQKPKLIRFSDDRKDFLFNDRSGQLWHKSGDELKAIGTSIEFKESGSWSGEWIQSYGFKDDGSFVFIHGYKLWTYTKETGKFLEISDQLPEDASCTAFDANGDIYVGTGQTYEPGCGGGPGTYGISSGIYKWNGDGWNPIIGGPNVWTYAMASDSRYGLAVGTSGSGLQFLKTK